MEWRLSICPSNGTSTVSFGTRWNGIGKNSVPSKSSADDDDERDTPTSHAQERFFLRTVGQNARSERNIKMLILLNKWKIVSNKTLNRTVIITNRLNTKKGKNKFEPQPIAAQLDDIPISPRRSTLRNQRRLPWCHTTQRITIQVVYGARRRQAPGSYITEP